MDDSMELPLCTPSITQRGMVHTGVGSPAQRAALLAGSMCGWVMGICGLHELITGFPNPSGENGQEMPAVPCATVVWVSMETPSSIGGGWGSPSDPARRTNYSLCGHQRNSRHNVMNIIQAGYQTLSQACRGLGAGSRCYVFAYESERVPQQHMAHEASSGSPPDWSLHRPREKYPLPASLPPWTPCVSRRPPVTWRASFCRWAARLFEAPAQCEIKCADRNDYNEGYWCFVMCENVPSQCYVEPR
ncbi:unnamed protein product [Boreogadus saida]